jgi:hypothetical protein
MSNKLTVIKSVVQCCIIVVCLFVFTTIVQAGPVASFSVEPNPAGPGQSLFFDASGSYHTDPCRSIISYEWDYDFDEITFNVDATGSTQTHPYSQFGSFIAALRITDNNSPPMEDIETIIVEISLGNHAPVADPGVPYMILEGDDLLLDASGSHSGDDSAGDYIASYQWDLDNDAQFDDATGENPVIPWSTLNSLGLTLGIPGTIGLRVTDSFGATSQSSTSLTIYACELFSLADLNNDCKVGFADLVLFVQDWLRNGIPFDPGYTEGP